MRRAQGRDTLRARDLRASVGGRAHRRQVVTWTTTQQGREAGACRRRRGARRARRRRPASRAATRSSSSMASASAACASSSGSCRTRPVGTNVRAVAGATTACHGDCRRPSADRWHVRRRHSRWLMPPGRRRTSSAPAPLAAAACSAVFDSGVLGGLFGSRANERRLGILTEILTDSSSEYFGVKDGVLVRSVTGDSPAAKAGVKAGDVITSVNGHASTNRPTSQRNCAARQTTTSRWRSSATARRRP